MTAQNSASNLATQSESKCRVLFINAPFYDLYGTFKAGVSYYYPLGIGYLASFLEKHGYQVDILVEAPGVDVEKELASLLKSKQYLFAGISSMTSSFPSAVRLARQIKAAAPDTPVVFGGPHTSAVGGRILDENPEVDMLVIGEGEHTCLEIARQMEGEKKLADILGLIWRDELGQSIQNPPRPFHDQLDDFTYPARHLVKFEDFSVHSHVDSGSGLRATLMTSRGCPFGCLFCSAHLTDGRKYRHHSEEYVINELKMLKERYNVGYVFFEDDTLTVVRKRVLNLCKKIQEADLGITFGCFSRVDVFDEELAQVLSATGVRLIIFGIESGVPEVLQKIGKKASLEDAQKAIKICNRYGMKSYASFVVGFPFETKEMIQQTINFGLGLNASVVTFNPLVPFPGTDLFDYQKHYPAKTEDWSRFLTTEQPPFDMVPGLSAMEVKAMCDKAHLRFYLKPSQVWRMLREIKSWDEFWGLVGASMGMLKRTLKAPAKQ